MAKQKCKLYMLQVIDGYDTGKQYLSPYKEHGMDHLKGEVVLLGETEIEVDFPVVDTRQIQIDDLQAAAEKERADSQMRVNILLDRISKLQAVGHDSDVIEG